MESDRGGSWARVDMLTVLLVLGVDAVTVVAVVSHTSDMISGVRCSQEAGE